MTAWRPPSVRPLFCPECKKSFRPRGEGHSPACSVRWHYQVPDRTGGWLFLVFGSRTDVPPGVHARLFGFLDGVLAKHPDMVLMHGGAKGIDFTASAWARDNGVAEEIWRPQYKIFENKWVPPLWRNAEMAHRKPEAGAGFLGPCVMETCHAGFPHGSHGSVDMAARALGLGVPVEPHLWGDLDELANWMVSASADQSGEYKPRGDGA